MNKARPHPLYQAGMGFLIVGAFSACAQKSPQTNATDMRANTRADTAAAAASTVPNPQPNTQPKQKRVLDWNQFETTAIIRTTRGKNTYICSAVLLSKNLALTTAHCVANSDQNEILLGKSLTDPKLRAYRVNTKKIRVHPDYHLEASLFHADLAVLPLLDLVPLTDFISIPDPSLDQSPETVLQPKQALERVGFGLRNQQNLRTWTEVFVDRLSGQDLYLNDALSVTGDSGSPIFLRAGSKIELIAMHTTLLEAGKVAGVYLPFYKKWIFSHSQTH